MCTLDLKVEEGWMGGGRKLGWMKVNTVCLELSIFNLNKDSFIFLPVSKHFTQYITGGKVGINYKIKY